jgi:hypothetical protein
MEQASSRASCWYFHDLLFNLEDGDMFLRNFGFFQRTTECYIPEGETLEDLYELHCPYGNIRVNILRNAG